MNKKVTIYSTAIPVQKLTPHNDIKHVELLSTAISSCENSFWHVLIKQIKQLNEAELKTLQVCLVCSSFCPPPGITMLNGIILAHHYLNLVRLTYMLPLQKERRNVTFLLGCVRLYDLVKTLHPQWRNYSWTTTLMTH